MGDPTYTYSAYGLIVRVPFRCSGLDLAGPEAALDLVVREGIVPRALATPTVAGIWWEADSSRFLHRSGLHGGRFLVQGGEVTLERNPRAEDGVLATAFVRGVLPRAIAQRDQLVLHANAAAIENQATVIAGDPGAGKSTALAELLRMGYPMLADDITVLATGADGHVKVLPGRREIRLPQESAARLDAGRVSHSRGPGARGKAVVPVPRELSSGPASLDRIYLLEASDDEDVSVTELSGSAKFDALLSCLYGPVLLSQHSVLLSVCTPSLLQADMFRLRRPAHRWSVEHVCSAILDHSTRIGR